MPQTEANPADGRPRLGAIRVVTLTAPDLDAVEEGYVNLFRYQRLDRRKVSQQEAASWGAPAAAGREMLTLRPQSGAETDLRFIEWPMPADFRPFATYGWNALEIVVQDPDALAEQIERSTSFKLKTGPHGIDTFPYLRACQAIGPAGEYLNLTRINPPRSDLPVARSFVDRCFIVTLGGKSITDLVNFYGGFFDNAVSEVREVRLRMMNEMCGLPEDTRHPLATVRLAGQTKLEIDECPGGCTPRGMEEGGLPWGVAMVSLECSDISCFRGSTLGAPLSQNESSRLAVMGPAGERLELIQTPC